ncbi:MAG TPA: hypothetical protein PKK40_05850, partial [Marmoricola sp.]|nr:hypothetical protein [Marmoricola sp.]
LLPKATQRRVMATTAKKAPLMGFVVEPSSSFRCFDVTDVAAASALLPEELAKSVADVDFDRIKPLSVAGLTTVGGASCCHGQCSNRGSWTRQTLRQDHGPQWA